MAFAFIKKFDIYGSKIDLNFQKNEIYKTYFGGFLSLMIFGFFGLGCWFYGKELILKEKPMVINQMRSVVQAEKINIQGDQLIFTLGIQANGAVFSDPTVFTVKGYQEYLVYKDDPQNPGMKSKQIIRETREVVKCDLENIQIDELKSYFLETAELKKTYCFKENQEKEVYIEGDYDNPKFAEVYVQVEKCQNSTSTNVICKPIEVINEMLKESIVTIYLSDRMINPNNFLTPFEYKGINQYALTYSNLPKELQLYFSNYYIQTDSGILYEEINEERGFIFTEMKETILQDNPNLVVRVLLRLQKQKEFLMQRRYQKIADIIAQIGGLLKLLTAFGAILSFPFSKLYLRKAIVDEIFNFDIDKSKLNNSNKQGNRKKSINKLTEEQRSKKHTQELNDLNSIEAHNSCNTFYPSKKQVLKIDPVLKTPVLQKSQSFVEEIRNIFKITKQKIQYNFTHFVSHIFCPKYDGIKHSRELVDRSVQKILEKLDILFILNKLLEIEKLKHVLLNEDQLKLFEFIPKPVISENQENDMCIHTGNSHLESSQIRSKSPSIQLIKQRKVGKFKVYEDEKDETNKAVDAYQGLLNIAQKKERSEIDDTLIQLIDPKIIDYFQNSVTEADLNMVETYKSSIQPKFQLQSEQASPQQIGILSNIRQKKQSLFFCNQNSIFTVPPSLKDHELIEESHKCSDQFSLPDKDQRPSFNEFQ